MPVWLLDLDGTLYTDRTGLWPVINERITRYVQALLALEAPEAQALRRRWVQSYGTTLRGLMAEFPDVADPHDYFAFAHDVPLEAYLAPDPRLRDVLTTLSGTQWVFTNADAAHARRVLAVLGVDDLMDGIIDIFATGLHPKPQPEAYRRALAHAGSPHPDHVVLVDDRLQNVRGARAYGMRAVWVTRDPEARQARAADAVIPDVYHLPDTLGLLQKEA